MCIVEKCSTVLDGIHFLAERINVWKVQFYKFSHLTARSGVGNLFSPMSKNAHPTRDAGVPANEHGKGNWSCTCPDTLRAS